MCTITAIDQTQEACPKGIGGIYALSLADFADLTAATVSGSSVTSVTGLTWVTFLHDKDGTAFFDQNGERPSTYVLKYVTDGFVKFVDVTDAKIAAVEDLGCCSLVGIAWYNNGHAAIFGIDPDDAGTDAKESLVRHQVTPSRKSGTSGEENRLEFVINGESEKLLSTTLAYATVNP